MTGDKRVWQAETEEALRRRDYEITPELRSWLQDFYDSQPDEWRHSEQGELEERKTAGLIQRIKHSLKVSSSDQYAYPPDDPRIVVLADALDRARGKTCPWLIWSGPLPDDDDETTAAKTLVRKRWWRFNGKTDLEEIGEGSATDLMIWLFGHTWAYHSELMSTARAAALAEAFISLIPAPRRWFTNGEDGPPPIQGAYSTNPATDYTLDLGVVAVAEGRAWIAWFTDED